MPKSQYHNIQSTSVYVQVVLPLALPKPYTYFVPEELVDKIQFGVRVEVQFGQNRLYTAIVVKILDEQPEGLKPKAILSVVDSTPIVNKIQLKLWLWMADYYACTIGEVMNAALPANLKLSSETRLVLSPVFVPDEILLNDQEFLITEALSLQEEISIKDVRDILNKETVYPLIKSMLEKHLIYLKEDLVEKYKPKQVACVRLCEPYVSQPGRLGEAFEKLSRSDRQAEALMAYIQLSKKQDFVRRQDIYKLANVDTSVINAIIKKEVFESYDREVSRMGAYEEDTVDAAELSDQQNGALEAIDKAFQNQRTVLLHGVTGSGKTRVYVEYIKKVMAEGKQALYLLPEIALTTQIVQRLQRIFGNDIVVYHSRMSNDERVEIWNAVLNGKPVVLGARSALFLPYQNLDLIVVDEEHDASFKQHDPAPRYNGRDAAVYLAHLTGAKTILGTATPSLESYQNAKKGKYVLVEMPERFGGIQMPKIVIADAKKELKEGKMMSHFTTLLLDTLKATLENGEQAILFQNRRGYSPTYRCGTCGWHSECINCDVSLTYHKFKEHLECHYCGYHTKLPKACPACGSNDLTLQGFGTEKIEDELKIYLPGAKVARMDLDTVRSKNALVRLINDFEEKRIDILVGTQMVTKGFDFESVGVVGVLSADQLLQFPDFRSAERAFQIMVQVSGRAGRKNKQGKVIIQAFNVAHPVLREVIDNDFNSFFAREIQERQTFNYPPFYKLIKITLRHKKPQVVNDGMRVYASFLKKKLGSWVIGPAVPYVSRVRGYYILDLMVKMEPHPNKMKFAKESIAEAAIYLSQGQGFSTIRVNVDVDPM
ncbi:MAG: primosomal protein N' [Saprospiraceae bacterium]|nr:primosomal protein N' [Saprospiraceae bacterium]MCB9324970.1 primosomal protein N' [Lewinellaceae bacterium]